VAVRPSAVDRKLITVDGEPPNGGWRTGPAVDGSRVAAADLPRGPRTGRIAHLPVPRRRHASPRPRAVLHRIAGLRPHGPLRTPAATARRHGASGRQPI